MFCAAQPPRPRALVWGSSEDGGACGCDHGHCRVYAISRQSVQWFLCAQPRPTQVHHSPEWPPVSLVLLSPGYEIEQALVSPIWISHRTDLARKSAERRGSMWSSGMEHLGHYTGTKGKPRITTLIGSAPSSAMTEARLCRSWTDCWKTRNSEPGLKFKGW